MGWALVIALGCTGDSVGSNTDSGSGESGSPWTWLGEGYYGSCGGREDGTIECWGFGSDVVEGRYAPELTIETGLLSGDWRSVTMGVVRDDSTVAQEAVALFGVDADGAVKLIRGPDFEHPLHPEIREEAWDRVTATDTYTCSFKVSGTVACWWSDYNENFPPGWFDDVAISGHPTVGPILIFDDGFISQFEGYSPDRHGAAWAPAGTTVASQAQYGTWCILDQGTYRCADQDAGTYTELDVPAPGTGSYTAMVGHEAGIALLDTDGHVHFDFPAFEQFDGSVFEGNTYEHLTLSATARSVQRAALAWTASGPMGSIRTPT